MNATGFLAPLNEAFMLSSAIAIGCGWWAVRHHKVHLHRILMLVGASLGAAFFLTYVLKTFLVGDTTFGGPHPLATAYQAFLQTHATLATVAGVLGVITLRYAFRRRFGKHRRVAPWTASLWFVAAASGFVVFLLLYVIYPPGPTTNILKAIIGG